MSTSTEEGPCMRREHRGGDRFPTRCALDPRDAYLSRPVENRSLRQWAALALSPATEYGASGLWDRQACPISP